MMLKNINITTTLTLTFTFLIFCICDSKAQTDLNYKHIDSLLSLLETEEQIMGACAIRSGNGKIVFNNAYGYEKIAASGNTASTQNTKYRIGSITKTFTATMIFQLVEEGKLKLDDKLSQFFPKIKNSDQITIAQLLYHRSGIKSYTDAPSYLSWNTEPKSRNEVIELIEQYPSVFPPGEKSAYSNSNYFLLGYIIEDLNKTSYDKALQSRICKKLGLTDTYFGKNPENASNEALSYEKENGSWKLSPVTDMSIPHGAGALISTPAELTIFIQALFSEKLISKTSLDQMTSLKDGYGMGIFRFPFNNRYVYGHTGGIDAFSSMLVYFPDDKVAIAYCSNGGIYSTNDVLVGVGTLYYGLPYTFPVFGSIALSEEALTNYEGIYTSSQIPLSITIKKNGKQLTAQATGQSAFPLSASSELVFRFDSAGIVLEFEPAGNDGVYKEFALKQRGGVYKFTKKE